MTTIRRIILFYIRCLNHKSLLKNPIILPDSWIDIVRVPRPRARDTMKHLLTQQIRQCCH
jgi:hypothetical protein